MTTASVVSAVRVDTNKLRNALRLVHCIQKERGSSCAYYANTTDVFESAMVEARAASDSSVQLMMTTTTTTTAVTTQSPPSSSDHHHHRHHHNQRLSGGGCGPDLPIASSLRKIRNLIDESLVRSKSSSSSSNNNKCNSTNSVIGNPQDPSNELIFHRIFVCFNTLISSIVHGCILNVPNLGCGGTGGGGDESAIASGMAGTASSAISPNRRTTLKRRYKRELSTDIDDKLQSNPDFANDVNNNYDGVPLITSEHHRNVEPLEANPSDGVMKGTTTTTATSSVQQQLLTLLHLFVQLKESAGVERAILSSLLAFRSHGTMNTLPSLRMLTNDLILEVENQRALYSQLQRLPSGQHHTLVLELAQLSPRLLDLHQIILSDFDSLEGLEYDSETIWDMITLYVDKLHSVELLIIEDLECSMPAVVMAPTNQEEVSVPSSQPRPVSTSTPSTSSCMLDTALEQLVHDNFDTDTLLDEIEGMSADSLKERVKELLRISCNNNNKQVGTATTTSNDVSSDQPKIVEIETEISSTTSSHPSSSSHCQSKDTTSADSPAGTTNNSDTNNNKKYLLDREKSKEWEISIYEINFTKRIGQGASATTYLGKWTNQNVAVKVASITEFGLEGWRTEVNALQRLHHPNIIRLMGSIYNESPQTHCLVLEYCNAGDLATALRYPTPRNFFFHVSSSIANAMAYLHKRGIMHRDLKPANILCDGNIASGNFVVKVTDFGISTDISRSKPRLLTTDPPASSTPATTLDEAESGLTGETGTYRWMSPEVIRHENYSSMADVYSYAVMLWQFITHEEPFCLVGSVEAARLTAIEKERPPMPKQIPEVLADMIQSNWNDDPNQRWEFSKIVERFQHLDGLISIDETEWLEEPYGHPVYTSEVGPEEAEALSGQQQQQLPAARTGGRRRESKQSRKELNRRSSSGRITSSYSPVRKPNLLSSFFSQRKKGSSDTLHYDK